jgi:CubicO group peptidase (beta-lactamase class C family)
MTILSLKQLTLAATLLVPLHAALPVMDTVDAAMKSFVEAREISGAVTLLADENEILHLSAVGYSDLANKTPMSTDSVFWIASMTKPVTATAVMMMEEGGKLSLDEPVSKYLPEFADLKDAAGNPVTITLKQCLNHTSGLSELSPEEAARITTLAELTPLVATKPVQFAPGSKWQYCQTGINTAARVVEVVSGKSFPDFLQERLFEPLGMTDTSFYPPAAVATRLANSYNRSEAGELEKADLFFLRGKSPTEKSHYPMANGGLFSTASDYMKFARMILNGGESDGKRYLKEETVKQMTGVRTGDLPAGFVPGSAWGLGWSIVREPQGVTAALSPGSFGHGGLFGTQAWIDPLKNRIFILMIQRANFTNQGGSDGSDIRRDFLNAAAN